MRADTPTDGGALILAAGYARRFGSDKRRHRLPDGRRLLIATLQRYLEVFTEVAVVIRTDDDKLADELAEACPTVRIIRTDEAHLGMGDSLAAGIRAISRHWSWVAVGLGDMPFVSAGTLRALERAVADHGNAMIVQPASGERTGHPVLFRAGCFAELAGLTGDTGARQVLHRHRDETLLVPVEDPGIFEDVDRPPPQ